MDGLGVGFSSVELVPQPLKVLRERLSRMMQDSRRFMRVSFLKNSEICMVDESRDGGCRDFPNLFRAYDYSIKENTDKRYIFYRFL